MLADLLLSLEVEVYRITILVFVEPALKLLENFRLEAFLQLRFYEFFGLSSDFLLHVSVFDCI